MHSSMHMQNPMDREEGRFISPITFSVFNNGSSDSDSE